MRCQCELCNGGARLKLVAYCQEDGEDEEIREAFIGLGLHLWVLWICGGSADRCRPARVRPCLHSFQEAYFKKHKFNTVPGVQLRNVDR